MFTRRHLVRLWLRDPEKAWKTPAILKDRWDGVYKDVTPGKQVLPLEPYIRSASKGIEIVDTTSSQANDAAAPGS